MIKFSSNSNVNIPLIIRINESVDKQSFKVA